MCSHRFIYFFQKPQRSVYLVASWNLTRKSRFHEVNFPGHRAAAAACQNLDPDPRSGPEAL